MGYIVKKNDEMDVLETARELVYGERRTDYGEPTEGLEQIAALWSAALKCPISPEQVCLCMILLKVSRLTHGWKRDSLVDIGGYALLLERYLLERGQDNA